MLGLETLAHEQTEQPQVPPQYFSSFKWTLQIRHVASFGSGVIYIRHRFELRLNKTVICRLLDVVHECGRCTLTCAKKGTDVSLCMSLVITVHIEDNYGELFRNVPRLDCADIFV